MFCPADFDSPVELDLHRRTHEAMQREQSAARERLALAAEDHDAGVGPLQGHTTYWAAERDFRAERRRQHTVTRLTTVKVR